MFFCFLGKKAYEVTREEENEQNENNNIASFSILSDYDPSEEARKFQEVIEATLKEDKEKMETERLAIEAKKREEKKEVKTHFWGAFKNDELKILEDILINDSDILFQFNQYGDTPLHHAIKEGKIDILIILLKWGADIHLKNKNNQSSLTLALEGSNDEIAEIMINSLKSSEQYTLMKSFVNDTQAFEKIEKIINLGVDINALNDRKEFTIFSLAIFKGRFELAKKLLDIGANINLIYPSKIDNNGTLLHFYCAKAKEAPDDIEKVQWLLQHGASSHIKDRNRNTPLFYAKKKGKKKVISLIQKKEITDLIKKRGT